MGPRARPPSNLVTCSVPVLARVSHDSKVCHGRSLRITALDKIAQAAAAYGSAMDGFLAAGSELVPGFESALAIDDGFALAEIGRARCLATYGHAAAAKASAARARTLAAGTKRSTPLSNLPGELPHCPTAA